MPDVELVAIHDSDAGLVAKRAAGWGTRRPSRHRTMLAERPSRFRRGARPARQMAGIAHDLIDRGCSVPDGEARGSTRARSKRSPPRRPRPGVRRGAARAALPRICLRARELIAAGRLGPLSHIYVRINRPRTGRYPAWDCAMDARPRRGRRRLPPKPRLPRLRHVPAPDRRAGVTGAQISRRGQGCAVEDYASVMLRSDSGVLGTVEVGNGFPRDAPTASGSSPAATPSSP